MDIVQLYQDYNVPFRTEGHKHCRPGWVNTECPFCVGNPGLHLGATLDGKIFYCWRCGIHSPADSLMKLTGMSYPDVKKLIIDYAGKSKIAGSVKVRIKKKAFKFPPYVEPITRRCINYLSSRGYDPMEIEKLWEIKATRPVAVLDGINYNHRIIIPIYWGDKIVSFQTRDVTGKHPLKYITCGKERELIHHKHIIYRNPLFKGRKGIAVEGVTDVWRFGIDAFCTFGIEYTRQQIRLIAQEYDEVTVVFDPDPQAIRQAKKLVGELKFRGVRADMIIPNSDPGDMTQKEANQFLKQIL